ncbi:MAG: hypothetical protein HOA15_05095 [Candidatus Marinimicrobia bacterium]|nr:hypothetical protein [Candidatus Neomarinimicrobiota bacterium]MBT3675914.1 hypothetical protein [Candidatus Neomarinimicrobiota bacterium]MBT3763199.1 hypothetical protein [Candidatus Neomarinimicrobiota bacterium]MBT4069338.1 hypothetical protein [Candidatus Neomarinimicrobiota bacterium]MBT4269951.1 hypothetical protein [Candidatus Neomarinimicrobiota bacterium]
MKILLILGDGVGSELAIEKAINAGWVTRDLGGSMGTIEMGDFICSKLAENIA